ncbi:hypothetical protein ARMSODRAFT_966274 [Armillaria solidipes]|uniref:Uncharacterized protein n=1 Tax=Armillaria solidipes TaxID=1076256 RepID=A0A2H3ARK8_9AGAR|nr:hypothetical protein ARMSODRAFT_966274 [Armillaria solidipes]
MGPILDISIGNEYVLFSSSLSVMMGRLSYIGWGLWVREFALRRKGFNCKDMR